MTNDSHNGGCPCRTFRHMRQIVLATTLILSCSASAEVTWILKSSTTGDLPAPNDGDQQTCCVVCDIDGDGEGHFRETIPWHGQGIHEGKFGDFNGDGRLDILLNREPHKSAQ